ncbi:hypothetical protein [Rhodococcoides kyotonense]|nr:hypothetical protein [Rhodococcus kyotonensis]
MSRHACGQTLEWDHDIAAAVAFLAGPRGRWINGQIIRANCGLV